MLDIGWPEMLVIAIVLIVVVGPKDLPKMLRTFGRTTSKLRSMAGDFRKQFDEALKEAELDEIKTLASDARKLNPAGELKKALNPMEKAAQDVKAGLDKAMKPSQPTPASPVARAAEPLKPGATALPGEGAGTSATKANGAAKSNAPVAAGKTAQPNKTTNKTGTAKTTPRKPAAAMATGTRSDQAKPAAPRAKPAAKSATGARATKKTGGTAT